MIDMGETKDEQKKTMHYKMKKKSYDYLCAQVPQKVKISHIIIDYFFLHDLYFFDVVSSLTIS